ncbi:hypothetical protein [Microbacterium hydrocarbonoxydans]|uniref:hypothetical protein n=1 Tax=Microbacterium hydrocarbonoxydans TaxID=273678 RepID=UPI003D956F8D
MASRHADHAEALRTRVLGSGVIDNALRSGAMRAGAGGDASLPEPYAALTRTIGERSYRVTDAQVGAVRSAAGTDRAAFEVIMSASIGAGLRRWDAAMAALEEAEDASR